MSSVIRSSNLSNCRRSIGLVSAFLLSCIDFECLRHALRACPLLPRSQKAPRMENIETIERKSNHATVQDILVMGLVVLCEIREHALK